MAVAPAKHAAILLANIALNVPDRILADSVGLVIRNFLYYMVIQLDK